MAGQTKGYAVWCKEVDHDQHKLQVCNDTTRYRNDKIRNSGDWTKSPSLKPDEGVPKQYEDLTYAMLQSFQLNTEYQRTTVSNRR